MNWNPKCLQLSMFCQRLCAYGVKTKEQKAIQILICIAHTKKLIYTSFRTMVRSTGWLNWKIFTTKTLDSFFVIISRKQVECDKMKGFPLQKTWCEQLKGVVNAVAIHVTSCGACSLYWNSEE